MNSADLQVFVDGAATFFNAFGSHQVIVGSPYLSTASTPPVFDYTGLIHLSGEFTGCVYATASQALLYRLLREIGESDINKENCLDLIGEMANTLAGNARNYFGEHFMISVPTKLLGLSPPIPTSMDILPYVIPMSWDDEMASLVICIDYRV